MAQGRLFDDPGRPTLREIWRERERELALQVNRTVGPADVPRLTAALRRLYEHMRDGRWHTATEIEAVAGRRYGGRLWELAKAGIPHESERLSGGEWRYRLVASPTNGIGQGEW